MTHEEKLTMLKVMVGSSDTDEVLSVYLGAYPYASDITEVPAKYEKLQCEIAAYLLNKRGAEGQTAHSENGISRSYESADVPASMLQEIIPYVGVLE